MIIFTQFLEAGLLPWLQNHRSSVLLVLHHQLWFLFLRSDFGGGVRLRDEYDGLRLVLLRDGERDTSEGVNDLARRSPRLGGAPRSLSLPASRRGGVTDLSLPPFRRGGGVIDLSLPPCRRTDVRDLSLAPLRRGGVRDLLRENWRRGAARERDGERDLE